MHRWRLSSCAAAAALAVTAAAGPATAAGAQDPGNSTAHQFVTRSGSTFKLGGKDFHYAGTNTYYLFYKSQTMVDDALDRAEAAGFPVVRTWGWSDTGAADGTGAIVPKPDGVYFQYFDGTSPRYNDGADGLAHLDYEVWKAKQDGLRLVIPFTNNWSDFGGMDQYVRWAGLAHHDDFYTSPVIRAWFQAYISHLLNHVNPLTGLALKDDPTIMAWEVANEPRCVGSGLYPASASCTTATLTSWASDTAEFVKHQDRHHLIGVGDEGFFATDPASADNTVDGKSGDDTLALSAIPQIDYMSYHLYPDSWGKDANWGRSWITEHNLAARMLNKPAVLGEFGYADKATRNTVYEQWADAFALTGGAGMEYWMLAGEQDDGTPYPDYDGYTVYCPSPVCTALGNDQKRLASGQLSFPPVADDDSVTTAFNTPVTFKPATNDIAYLSQIKAAEIDLDPATPGQQEAATTTAGTWVLNADGSVTFTPAAGFHGKAVLSYTVPDSFGTASNQAGITVTVKPDPTASILFASFENPALDGWGPASWQSDAGTVSQESGFATDGSSGLHVATTGGGWFGTNLATPVDLSGKTALSVDLRTGASAGSSVSIAVQNGSSYTWCQGAFSWVGAGTTTTSTADLANGFSCDVSTLTDVRAIWVYLSPSTSVDLDNVRSD